MKSKSPKTPATSGTPVDLLQILETRFAKNPQRHKGIAWADVKARLDASPARRKTLQAMEDTGGEPDVIGHDKKSGEFIFADCSPESPAGRASLCYDREALDSRKEFKPKNSVMDLAKEMGVEVLGEEQYHELQKLGEFDLKSSSWLKTPAEIRQLGGALFGDRRFGRVFVYHNGAQSYYSGRGFRGAVRV
jgi:hypothetical protein